MVTSKQKLAHLADGSLDIASWLQNIKQQYALSDTLLLDRACQIAQPIIQGLTTFYGQPCLEQGLEIAEIIFDLKLDQEAAAAGILNGILAFAEVNKEDIEQQTNRTVAKLVTGIIQMNKMTAFQKEFSSQHPQLDKARKLLLAIATDIRVVIIKLAERLCIMRGIKSIPAAECKRLAQEVLNIYAPLANRLGIGQLKWELEDLAFRYVEPEAYKKIAAFLAERRIDREDRIKKLIAYLDLKLREAHLNAKVTGRAKHIYSIYLKAQRKKLSYEEIYDSSAIRILVPTIQDCYAALGLVHSLWPPVIDEFDDYIANPKPNGYRSIHTAVIGDDGKHFEIQIRTHTMHEEAECGVAAHWIYKENKSVPLDDAVKISYLQQLLDWHQEVALEAGLQTKQMPFIDDQVYVITPAGDILDLPCGATPLDFAYHIHSGLGHRCRGAKINGHIVPLTYKLQTGDKVEIITSLHGTPSRDWLNLELGYIITTRSKNKIAHWFKQQDFSQHIEAGRQLLERELTRAGLAQTTSLSVIARHLNLKNEENFLAALGRGNVRIGQVLQLFQPKQDDKELLLANAVLPLNAASSGSAIVGAADLLTRFAKCCKPIPGDAIIGYITQGRGISVHKKNCNNVKHFSEPKRFIPIAWETSPTGTFSTDLKITTHEEASIFHELTALFANEKIDLLKFNSTFSKNQILITVTLRIKDQAQLNKLIHRIQHLPGVIEVMRVAANGVHTQYFTP